MVPGAKDERFNVLLGWADARDATAPTVVLDVSSIPSAERLGQHVFMRDCWQK